MIIFIILKEIIILNPVFLLKELFIYVIAEQHSSTDGGEALICIIFCFCNQISWIEKSL